MSFDDPFAEGQAQACACALRLRLCVLGSEERVEYPWEIVCGYAASAVLYAQYDDIVLRMGVNSEKASSGQHCLSGIQDEIHEDLLEGSSVGGDSKVGGDRDFDLYPVLGKVPGETGKNLVHHLRDGPIAQIMFSAGSHCEDAVEYLGGLARILDGLCERLVCELAIIGVLQGKLGKTAQGSQYIVHLVGDHRADDPHVGKSLSLVQLSVELAVYLLLACKIPVQ